MRAALVRAAQALERAGLNARFELPEKLHVTLAFLGSVNADRVSALIESLGKALAGTPGFRVRFDTIGAFPNKHHARIAWAGAQHADGAFTRLAESVRVAARAFATLDDKRAVLHVTLARLRDAACLPRIALPPCEMDVAEVVLFESLPGGETSRYQIVERFPLTTQTSSPSASR
jgi:2'-5' RNA ligase